MAIVTLKCFSHLFTTAVSHGAQRCFESLVLLVFDFGVACQLLLVLPREVFPERLELLLLLLVPLCPLLGQHGSVTVLLLLSHPLHLLHLVALQLAYLWGARCKRVNLCRTCSRWALKVNLPSGQKPKTSLIPPLFQFLNKYEVQCELINLSKSS